jgi:hypothetical protein
MAIHLVDPLSSGGGAENTQALEHGGKTSDAGSGGRVGSGAGRVGNLDQVVHRTTAAAVGTVQSRGSVQAAIANNRAVVLGADDRVAAVGGVAVGDNGGNTAAGRAAIDRRFGAAAAASEGASGGSALLLLAAAAALFFWLRS